MQGNLIPSAICINWFSGYFLRNNNKNKNSQDFPGFLATAAQARTPLMEEELPADFYIGSAEVFAGVLVYILPIPRSSVLAAYMVGDGARRIADGLKQYSDERRSDPTFIPVSGVKIGKEF